MISAYKIDISALDEKQLQVLTPLFVEMESMGMTLDCGEFVAAAKRLYASVPLPDKAVLVGTGKTRKPEEPELTFQPQLCRNSLRIANRLRNSRGSKQEDQHDRVGSALLERLIEERFSQEMQLTFQPRVMLGMSPNINSGQSSAAKEIDSRNRYATLPGQSVQNNTHMDNSTALSNHPAASQESDTPADIDRLAREVVGNWRKSLGQ